MYLPFYRNLMTKGKETEFRSAVERITGWPIRRILPCHGTTIESGQGDDALYALKAHLIRGIPQCGYLPDKTI